MKELMGGIGLGSAVNESSLLSTKDMEAIDDNQDLSRDWKVIRRFENSVVMYHEQYRADLAEFSRC